MIKRSIIFSGIIIFIDQMLRTFFQLFFQDKVILWGNWGFTYVTNKGLWISPGISEGTFVLLQIVTLTTLLFIFYAYKYYKSKYRKSIWMDLSFGFCANALMGNVIIDRLLFGYIRDYFINPIAISNLADFSIEIALLLLVIEVAVNKDARNLFRWGSIRDDIESGKKLINFIKDDIRKHR